MRLTEKISEDSYLPKNEQVGYYTMVNKLGQLEDIEDVLRKTCFYGYVVDHGIQKIKFVRIYQGSDYDLDIRIEFELANGLGNVFYNIFDYGKTWALTKEELL